MSDPGTSYKSILKSSSIMGGAASITMILGIIKTKFAAVLIGTSGVGMLASFTAIQGLMNTVASLGLNSSAVRDVAAAVVKGDQQAIGRTVQTLRRMCWLTGVLGMSTLAALSPMIGQFTFASDKYDLEIALLGLVILFANVSGGQMAVIQGSRRIGDIARINITSAAITTCITVGLYFWLGLRGIVPALVVSAILQFMLSWHFARRVPVPHVEMTWRESFNEAGSMVKLGIAMMWTGLGSSLVGYATVSMISNQFDLHSVGIYSAAFALSGMFVKFVLQAMAADYYPRLAGVADDKEAMGRLVNEQTEIGLLLVVPGILVTLVFAPWIVQLFYSEEFMPAVDLLQWFILGCLGRVISWPLGYVMLATSNATWLVLSETVIYLLHILLIYLGLIYIGIEGVGLAFCILYLLHIAVVCFIAKFLINFKWDSSVVTMMVGFWLVFTVTFYMAKEVSGLPVIGLEIVVVMSTGLFCLRGIVKRVGSSHRFIKTLMKIPGMNLLFKGASSSHT